MHPQEREILQNFWQASTEMRDPSEALSSKHKKEAVASKHSRQIAHVPASESLEDVGPVKTAERLQKVANRRRSARNRVMPQGGCSNSRQWTKR
jgi:hypothetical protein